MEEGCAICGKKAVARDVGTSFCIVHLHAWLNSDERKTAFRVYGPHSEDRKKEIQVQALVKLFLSRQEHWVVREPSGE